MSDPATGGCTFSQSPLRVLPEPVELPKRPYKFFPTAGQLNFVDAQGKNWVAPPRTLTDGASIPKIFVAIVGDPTAPEFINAAAVHDAYCGVGNETGTMFHRAKWEDVHVMFYDGLIVGGTPEIRAKIMFAAVWLGGRVGRHLRGLWCRHRARRPGALSLTSIRWIGCQSRASKRRCAGSKAISSLRARRCRV